MLSRSLKKKKKRLFERKKNKDEGKRLALEIYLKETLHNHKINSQKKKGRKKDKK